MCGIACIFKEDLHDIVDGHMIEAMCNVIKYRGPDDSGVEVGQGFGMGARRLAILDLSKQGHMPMESDDGRHLIVYNGEVYNFKEIKAGLEEFGIKFKTGSDTEVVLKAYLHYGSVCLKMFNGMFAFAIYDKNEKTAFIARDRLGIKPLFYSLYNNQLVVASEIKSFWETHIPKVFNSEKFGELFSFRYVAGQETIYNHVKKLMPGHYLTYSSGKIELHEWWNLRDYALNEEYSPKRSPTEWYRETFDDAVKLRNISDVPVGILLSGGLDSSSVAAALTSIHAGKLSSFTVRFTEKKYDEGELAKLVAEKCDLDYNELYINEQDVFQKLVNLISSSDEPIFHGSDLFVKEISSYAKSKVTVLLSGEGGDETLGGYVRYNPLRYSKLLRLGFVFRSFLNFIPTENNRVKKLIKMLSLKTIGNFIFYNSSDIFPIDLKKLGFLKIGKINYRKEVLAEALKAYPNEPLRQVMFYDMKTFLCSLLDRNDLTTMKASIECRVPFLDYRLVEGLAAMPSKDLLFNNEPKGLLRRSFGQRLPKEILAAKKMGFAVPWVHYYRNIPDFKNYLLEISKHKLVIDNFSDPEVINTVVDQFLSGDDSSFTIVSQLFNICMWYDIHFIN